MWGCWPMDAGGLLLRGDMMHAVCVSINDLYVFIKICIAPAAVGSNLLLN